MHVIHCLNRRGEIISLNKLSGCCPTCAVLKCMQTLSLCNMHDLHSQALPQISMQYLFSVNKNWIIVYRRECLQASKWKHHFYVISVCAWDHNWVKTLIKQRDSSPSQTEFSLQAWVFLIPPRFSVWMQWTCYCDACRDSNSTLHEQNSRAIVSRDQVCDILKCRNSGGRNMWSA